MKSSITKGYKGKRKGVIFPLFLLFFVAALIASFNLLHLEVLSIEEQNTGVKAVFPLKEEEEFKIVYTHSVDLLPVSEIFFREKKNILLKETHFYNFGAGMGLLEERGLYSENEYGILKIVDIYEEVDPFVLRTGETADHQLYYRGKKISLLEIFGDQASLKLEIKKVSLMKVIITKVTCSMQ